MFAKVGSHCQVLQFLLAGEGWSKRRRAGVRSAAAMHCTLAEEAEPAVHSWLMPCMHGASWL